ncbi:hypothetical protein RF11_12878 [Thelohanellus kitauei]|uniref:Uncharacterized protein n=1 Tax=Thelohanellus kitauei TaxID=669202 RepID=A0A0C2I8A0_THEKT|nr:hypothetical protein RF11_12878 [Thelohanellus kitauei]
MHVENILFRSLIIKIKTFQPKTDISCDFRKSAILSSDNPKNYSCYYFFRVKQQNSRDYNSTVTLWSGYDFYNHFQFYISLNDQNFFKVRCPRLKIEGPKLCSSTDT